MTTFAPAQQPRPYCRQRIDAPRAGAQPRRRAIMKQRRNPLTHLLGTIVLTAMLVPLVSVVSVTAAQSGARLKLPDFSQLATKAAESVDISLDTSLLGLAAKFMSADDEKERAVKEMVQNLQGIYVKSFEFDSDNGYSRADVDAVRQQLSAPGWSRLVGVRSRRDSSDVDVFVWMTGDKPGGLAIIASEPRQLTIVNIIGAIDLEKLRNLEGEFGIPKLGIERDGKSKPKLKDKDGKTKPDQDQNQDQDNEQDQQDEVRQ